MAKERTITTRKRGGGAAERARFGLRLVAYSERGLVGMTIALDKSGTLGREGTLVGLSEDRRASRVHASISEVDGAFVIRDEGSKNGTFVNRARVSSATLVDNDVVRVGETLFVFEQLTKPFDHPWLFGQSGAFSAAVVEVQRLAPTELAILLVGETGVGKELFARYAHEQSGRTGELVTVNCAAITETLFESELFGHLKGAFSGATANKPGFVEQAEGGTLFLDEIGDLPSAQQTKLLRLLETGDYTPVGATSRKISRARIVAATNVPVDAPDSGFRRDLYSRLATGLVRVPPLRARKGDIGVLADHFLAGMNVRWRLADLGVDAVELLLAHDWPLNVRELRAVMQRLSLGAPPVEDTALATIEALLAAPVADGEPAAPAGVAKPATKPPRRAPMEKDVFLAKAQELEGNVVQLAKHFDVARRQIYRWFEVFAIDPDSLRKR